MDPLEAKWLKHEASSLRGPSFRGSPMHSR